MPFYNPVFRCISTSYSPPFPNNIWNTLRYVPFVLGRLCGCCNRRAGGGCQVEASSLRAAISQQQQQRVEAWKQRQANPKQENTHQCYCCHLLCRLAPRPVCFFKAYKALMAQTECCFNEFNSLWHNVLSWKLWRIQGRRERLTAHFML